MADTTNFPDLLGYITGGPRLVVNGVHVALAIRPAQARAGQPFEVIVLAQSAVDVDIDLIVTLSLPDVDARRQRGRFTAKSSRIVVGMKPAEVGYLVIPVMPLPDAQPSPNYKISVDVDTKMQARGTRVRSDTGGGRLNTRFLPDGAIEKMDALRSLKFATKRAGRVALEASFELLPPKLGHSTESIKTGWISLAKIADYKDPRLALRQYGDLITTQLLPRLKREQMFEPLIAATQEVFSKGGFVLRDCEAKLIARLMALILEYADPKDSAHGYIAAGKFAIKPLLVRDPLTVDENIHIPQWMQGMLSSIAQDERTASFPSKVIPSTHFFDLLYDATLFGFELVTGATGEDLGSPTEIDDYARQNISFLKRGSGMDFSRVYLPLVMGGILVNDRLLMEKEDPSALLREEGAVIEERVFEIADDDMPIYNMTNQLIMQAGQKYGFYK